jgi:malate dehydrogenase
VEEGCGVALAASAFPRARVVGVAGAVESLRLRAGVARELGVSSRDVTALVLGGRGGRAVPVLRALRVGGTAVTDKLPAERLAGLVAALSSAPPAGVRTVAAATAEVVEALACDRHAVLACALLCQGELGVQDAVAGVPVVLGAGGVERVLDVTLDEDEAAALAAAAVPYST